MILMLVRIYSRRSRRLVMGALRVLIGEDLRLVVRVWGRVLSRVWYRLFLGTGYET